jgi:UAA transporter family
MMRRANRTTSTDDADVAAGEAAAAAAAAAASAMTSAASHFLANGVGGSSTNSPIPSYASPLRHNPGAAPRHQHSHMSDQIIMNDSGGGIGPNGASSADDFYLSSAPASSNSLFHKAGSDLDFFEDHISDPVLVLGFDISHLSRQAQFLVCASGVFWFSLLYGYLQELISVQLCNRKLGLFLATAQFTGYTVLAYFLREFVYTKEQRQTGVSGIGAGGHGGIVGMFRGTSRSPVRGMRKTLPASVGNGSGAAAGSTAPMLRMGHTSVPFLLYLGLSLLRAVDLGMTNLAMQYINYPAKTLMKSSRVVFTMLFGVIISRKSYGWRDYAIVVCMCVGLALFMHADATSSAVFHHMGVIMLIVSLVCDGAITNMSESIMKQFGVGQDEVRFESIRPFREPVSLKHVSHVSAAVLGFDDSSSFACTRSRWWPLRPPPPSTAICGRVWCGCRSRGPLTSCRCRSTKGRGAFPASGSASSCSRPWDFSGAAAAPPSPRTLAPSP